MKKIKGYLIDPTTGAGIAGEAVSFSDLSGSPITVVGHGTVYQEKDSVTQADGSFSALFELSPGPVEILVDVSASEKRVRMADEKAQLGYEWTSDISRLGKAIGSGVVKGFLDELALSVVAGHTFRVGTGAAIIDGSVWSLEDLGGASGYDILGTSNPGGSGLNPRLDLVSLRQYHEDASGQLSGKQDVVVTLGTTSDVVPATPTGADFTALPLGVLSTAEGAATKTIHTDLRDFINHSAPAAVVNNTPSGTVVSITNVFSVVDTVTLTGLFPGETYDGHFEFHANYDSIGSSVGEFNIRAKIDSAFMLGGVLDELNVLSVPDTSESQHNGTLQFSWPVVGVTGITELELPIQLRMNVTGATTFNIRPKYGFIILHPRR